MEGGTGGRLRAAFGGWLLCLNAAVVQAADGEIALRGEYILRAAGCVACHTDADNDGQFLAGGRRFDTPFGRFYSPNITPDPMHGLGAWSEEDFVHALAEGIAPNGSHYYPVFPYTSYTRMQPEDMRLLWTYLTTVKPVPTPNRPHEVPWYLAWRGINWGWKLLHFEAGPFQTQPARGTAWNRGAYLAEALGHCGECHTPRGRLGGIDHERHYAGTKEGPDAEVVPNITPDRGTGIGRWSLDDLEYFLESGGTPDGDYTGSLMAEVIDENLVHLTATDRLALAIYLRSLPPIEHQVRKPARKRRRSGGEFD